MSPEICEVSALEFRRLGFRVFRFRWCSFQTKCCSVFPEAAELPYSRRSTPAPDLCRRVLPRCTGTMLRLCFCVSTVELHACQVADQSHPVSQPLQRPCDEGTPGKYATMCLRADHGQFDASYKVWRATSKTEVYWSRFWRGKPPCRPLQGGPSTALCQAGSLPLVFLELMSEVCMLPIGTQEQNIMGIDEKEVKRTGYVHPHHAASVTTCRRPPCCELLWQVLKFICHELKEKGRAKKPKKR